MKLHYFTAKKDLLNTHKCVQHLYPELSLQDYELLLVDMLKLNYGQIAVINEGEVIGVCGVWRGTKLWCGKYLEMDNVIIAPEFRSKGLGALISDYAHKIARENNCNIITLDAYTTNFKAHKFYYNQGFEPKGFHFVKDLNKKGSS